MSYQLQTHGVVATGPYINGGLPASGPHLELRTVSVYTGPVNLSCGRCEPPSAECCKSFLMNAFKWTAVMIAPFIPIFIAAGNGSISKGQPCRLNTVVIVAYAVCSLFSVLQCAYAYKNCCCPREPDNRPCASMKSAYPIAATTGALMIAIELLWYTSCK